MLYQHTAQKTASDIHRRLYGDDPRDLHRFVWMNPVETLIGLNEKATPARRDAQLTFRIPQAP
ncbi:hypothetical protein [Streptomyces sp. NPDC014734]|uniref:hypothetical protein n=1 Tax=Streptomyces sp. NPDC014734 TaxID=3364886 RepID=UPI0036F824E5